MTILYNVTIKVDHSIARDWRQWMLQVHIPALIATGCFVDAKFYRLLEQDDTEGPTFSAQYFCASKEDYERYLADFAPQMRAETMQLWGKHYVAFRSVMELQH